MRFLGEYVLRLEVKFPWKLFLNSKKNYYFSHCTDHPDTTYSTYYFYSIRKKNQWDDTRTLYIDDSTIHSYKITNEVMMKSTHLQNIRQMYHLSRICSILYYFIIRLLIVSHLVQYRYLLPSTPKTTTNTLIPLSKNHPTPYFREASHAHFSLTDIQRSVLSCSDGGV